MATWRAARLPGGLRVSLLPAPRFHAVRVNLYARVGSRHEPARSAGLTHLLEHMLFRGSRRFPDQRRLLRALDAIGADYGAYTTQEFLEAGMTVHPSRLEEALDLLREIAFRPRFPDLEVEKRIVTEEIRDDLDDADRMFALRSARLVWGRHPLGQPIAGWNVRAFRRADVERHWRRWFVPQNLLLGIAGRFHPSDALRALRGRFSLPARAAALPSPLPAPLGRGLRFRRIQRPVEKIRIHLAFAAPLVRREDLLITWVLTRVLGQRLMERVRDRDGLTYAIGCEPATLSDVLGLSLATSVAPRNTERMLAAILEEVGRAAREPVPAAELRRAQASMVWSYDFLKDDLEQFADFYEFQALFHPGELPRSPAAAQGVLRRLTPERLLQNARELLRSRYLTVVVMGDLPRERWAAARALVRASVLGPDPVDDPPGHS